MKTRPSRLYSAVFLGVLGASPEEAVPAGHDGTATATSLPQEIEAAPGRTFEQADADGGGRLDAHELARLQDR